MTCGRAGGCPSQESGREAPGVTRSAAADGTARPSGSDQELRLPVWGRGQAGLPIWGLARGGLSPRGDKRCAGQVGLPGSPVQGSEQAGSSWEMTRECAS